MATKKVVAERPVRCTCTHLHSAHSPEGCEHCKCKAYRPDSTPKHLREVGVTSGEWHMRPNRQIEVQLMSRETDKTRVYNLLLLHSTLAPRRKGSSQELETEEGKRYNIGRLAVVEVRGSFRPMQPADIISILNQSEYDPLKRMSHNWLKKIMRELEEERKIRSSGPPHRGQRKIHVYARPSLRSTVKKKGYSHPLDIDLNHTKQNNLQGEISKVVNSVCAAAVKSLFRLVDEVSAKVSTKESITPRVQEFLHNKVEDLKRFTGEFEEGLLALLEENPELAEAARTAEPSVPLKALRPLFSGESISDERLNSLDRHLYEEYSDVYTPEMFVAAVTERKRAGPIRFGLLLRWEAGFWVDDLFVRLRRDAAERNEQEERARRYQEWQRAETIAELRGRLQDPATRSDTIEMLTDTARMCGCPVAELYPELADLLGAKDERRP